MNPRLAIVRLLALLGTLLLVSCIDGQEEYWLNANGSGRAEITYSLPAAAARFQGGAVGVEKMLGGFLENTPAITASTHEVMTRGGRLTVRVTARFDSVLELRDVSHGDSMRNLPSSAKGLCGDITLDFFGREVHASRVISAGKALPGSSILPASRFADHSLTYIVHLPMTPTVSNATRTENDGRTLVWEIPLAEAVRQPITLRFEAPMPVPMGLLVGGIVGVVLLVMAVFVVVRRRRRTPRASGDAEPDVLHAE